MNKGTLVIQTPLSEYVTRKVLTNDLLFEVVSYVPQAPYPITAKVVGTGKQYAFQRHEIEEPKDLVNALKVCKSFFMMYSESHRAKGTPDGEEKAQTNDKLARLIDSVIGGKNTPG